MSYRLEGRPVRILLVEDNPADVRLTREAMKEAKVRNELNVALDGEDALDYLHKRGKHADVKRPDVILLDLNLPRKSGLEVLKEIKEDDELKRIPVVVITSSKAEQDIVRTYNLHANCFVTKPVDLNQFLEVVRSIEDFWLSIVRLPPQE